MIAGKCLKRGSSDHKIKDCPRLQQGVQRGAPAPAVAAAAPAIGRLGRPRAPARVFALAREDAEQAEHVTEGLVGDTPLEVTVESDSERVRLLIFSNVLSAIKDNCFQPYKSMSDTIDMDVEESVSLDTQVRDVSTSSSTKGRRLRSLVWNDFTRERKGNDGFVAICNHCQKVLSRGSQHGTTHLKKHLRICIPYQDARRGKSGDNEDFKFNQELSREKLAHMLVMHEYPFSMVEHCGFVDFVKSL
ncbi:hypothetical protein Taro_021701 [Colocasia esculenta]|uniref:BED-type domain-containing protein n=1 Tax=Colocasia esculenta TaxID=4460 RepID=A0A843UZS0_COLES|nr:hypothetical protein [Colocasia esculenta]